MTSTGRVVSANVKALMAITATSGSTLGSILGRDKSTVSRKLKMGTWTVEDIDQMGAHWGVSAGQFFEDPKTHFGVDIPSSACFTGVDPKQLNLSFAA